MLYTTTAAVNVPGLSALFTEAEDSYTPGMDTTFKATLEHARRMTTMFGVDNPKAAVAWEMVAELQTARVRSACPRIVTPRAAFVQYYKENQSDLHAEMENTAPVESASLEAC